MPPKTTRKDREGMLASREAYYEKKRKHKNFKLIAFLIVFAIVLFFLAPYMN